VETPDVEGLPQHEDPPSAIIAANDRMALGVIAAAIDLPRIERPTAPRRLIGPVPRYLEHP
jgi:hypothetical protein